MRGGDRGGGGSRNRVASLSLRTFVALTKGVEVCPVSALCTNRVVCFNSMSYQVCILL